MISDQTALTQFNYHVIKSVLKSHNFVNFIFRCIVPSRAGLLVIAEPETLLFTMQIDVMSRKLIQAYQHPSSSGVRTKTVFFMHQSSILFA